MKWRYNTNEIENDNGNVEFTALNNKGQSMVMVFTRISGTFDDHYSWFISLSIMEKRKNIFPFLQTTGRDGISCLLWAKDNIKYFVENCLDRKIKNTIYINADNSQRFKVYVRGLQDLGFKITRDPWGERALCMVYKPLKKV